MTPVRESRLACIRATDRSWALGVDVGDADDELLPAVLHHQGRLQADVNRPAVHEHPVIEGIDARLADGLQHPLPGEHGIEQLLILGIDRILAVAVGNGEEILALRRQPQALEVLGRAEHGIASALQIDGVDANIVARQREDAGISRLFLADLLQGFAGLHQLVNVQNADNDVAVIAVAHAGGLQLHVFRHAVKQHAIIQHEGVRFLQGL